MFVASTTNSRAVILGVAVVAGTAAAHVVAAGTAAGAADVAGWRLLLQLSRKRLPLLLFLMLIGLLCRLLRTWLAGRQAAALAIDTGCAAAYAAAVVAGLEAAGVTAAPAGPVVAGKSAVAPACAAVKIFAYSADMNAASILAAVAMADFVGSAAVDWLAVLDIAVPADCHVAGGRDAGSLWDWTSEPEAAQGCRLIPADGDGYW